MRPKREIEVGRIEVRRYLKAGLHARWQIPGEPKNRGDFSQSFRLLGMAIHLYFAVDEANLRFTHFEQMRTHFDCLLFNQLGSFVNRRSFDTETSASIAALRVWHSVGGGVENFDSIHRRPEFLGRNLRKGCYLPLAVRLTAGDHRHVAGFMNTHHSSGPSAANEPFPAHSGRGSDAANSNVRADTNPKKFAAFPCFRLAL